MRAPRIQGASRRRGVPFPEGRRTGAGPSACRVRRRPAPGDNGPPARELVEGPRPRAAGNGEKNNDGRPAMTSIDGLLAILEDRGSDARGRIVLAHGRSRASLPELREPPGAKPPPPTKPRHRIRRIDVPRHGMPCGRDGDAVTMGNESDERNGNEGLR